jgi:hypothetical protein
MDSRPRRRRVGNDREPVTKSHEKPPHVAFRHFGENVAISQQPIRNRNKRREA